MFCKLCHLGHLMRESLLEQIRVHTLSTYLNADDLEMEFANPRVWKKPPVAKNSNIVSKLISGGNGSPLSVGCIKLSLTS